MESTTQEEVELTQAELEPTTVRFEAFCVITSEPERFIDELEELCKKYSDDENFFFNFVFE